MLNKEILFAQAMEATNRINKMEEQIAKEMFGCSYDELDYDDKDFVTCEAYDRLGTE